MGYKPIVVINKIDRKDARPHAVLDEIFDLFVMLDATNEQLDFPVLYAVAKEGIAKVELEDESDSLTCLLDKIVDHVPAPDHDTDAKFKMLVSSIDWNDYVGRIAVGRIEQGTIKIGQEVALMDRNGKVKEKARATKLFTFSGLQREPVEHAVAGHFDGEVIHGLNAVDRDRERVHRALEVLVPGPHVDAEAAVQFR